jgi:hypothetical protein
LEELTDTDHFLVVAKFEQKLSVSKRAAQKFYVDRFNIKKLNDVDFIERYEVKISDRFCSFGNVG